MNYRTERLPVVTFSLIGINTLVWLATLILDISTDGQASAWVTGHLWLTPASSPWYSWLTSMFVHANIFHLLGNLIFLFLFGCCVEDLIGRWRYLLFYLAGGLVAEGFYVAVNPLHFASLIPLGGASGAISTCMGMYLMLRTEADIEFKYFYFLMFMRAGAGEFECPAWMAVGFWFLKDLFWMILGMCYPNFAAGGGTAFGAHVGGLLAGVGFIALQKLPARISKKDPVSNTILSPEEIQAAASSPGPSPMDVPTIYLHEYEGRTGPFTLAEIQTRLAEFKLDPRTLYWTQGMKGWEPVGDLADNSLR